MKLVAGKKYRNGLGQVMLMEDMDPEYNGSIYKFKGDNEVFYTEDGRVFTTCSSRLDIVSEELGITSSFYCSVSLGYNESIDLSISGDIVTIDYTEFPLANLGEVIEALQALRDHAAKCSVKLGE